MQEHKMQGLQSPKNIEIQVRRLKQIIWATILAFFLALVANASEKIDFSVYAIGGSLLTLICLLPALYKGKTEIVAKVFLAILVFSISALIAKGSGLKDSGVLAYPAILIFAAILTSRRYFIFIATLIAAVVFSIGYIQIVHPDVIIYKPTVRVTSVIDIFIILTATGFSIFLLLKDLRVMNTHLEAEIERSSISQQKVHYLSLFDTLTGLPNRNNAKKIFENYTLRASSLNKNIALVLVDLDSFKDINDSFGNHFGDQLLTTFPQVISPILKPNDALARIGGDEFLIILDDIPSIDIAENFTKKLFELLEQPLEVGEHSFNLSCTVGISIFPDHANDFETLLTQSEIAMEGLKELGRNQYFTYNPDKHSADKEKLLLYTELREAIQNHQFELHYQPQIDLKSGKIVGAEALVRWRHPEKGLIPPFHFIPIAESSGLITDIGAWVLETACQQAVQWIQEFSIHDFKMAVNLSPVQFTNEDLTLVVQKIIDKTGISPYNLELELTESTLIDDHQVVQDTLDYFKNIGISISIDDFGTGYSNLGYLQKFNVGTLKVDRSFVMKMRSTSNDEALVNAILQMAKSLNLETVAEGIEENEDYYLLRKIGCDKGQGFLWSKPVPAIEFEKLISKS